MLNKPMVAMIFVFFNLFFLPIAFAVDCPIPDTGQTKCYDGVGNEIDPCPSLGEPFYGQDAQYGPNLQSYTKLDENGDDLPDIAASWEMVRDNVTGLIWEVKQDKDELQNYANPHDADNRYTWYDSNPETNGGDPGTPGDGTDTEDFINALNSANFGGHSDWRLPTVKELSTIVDSSISFPAINTAFFPNTVSSYSSYYWSSTTYAFGPPGGAWGVVFDVGGVGSGGKSYRSYVRAVRSGQCGSFGDFVDNEDGTVTDKETGLMWEVKESKDGTPDYGNPRDADNDYTWENALSLCENLSLAGYDDWRLPNRNELQSLVDYSQYNPSIDTTFFPNTVSSGYWSSTTHAGYPGDAWLVSFDYGWVGHGLGKSYYGYVRAVRAGQCGSFGDSDGDGICDDGDDNGTPGDNPCTGGETVFCDDNCPDDYNPGQEDTMPSGGNGCGDACECEGDFEPDGDVDGSDAFAFKEDFFRKDCSTNPPCDGDFECDGDVDGSDGFKFKQDFFRNDCPTCGGWPCVY